MKRLIVLFAILGCIASCERKEEEKDKGCKDVDLSKYTSIPEEQVRKMASRYLEIVKDNPQNAIQHINMDGEFLRDLMCKIKSVKLVSAADSNDLPTIIFQIWKENSNPLYYDIKELFKADMRGMGNKPPVCPPPNLCDLPFIETSYNKTDTVQKKN